eukprot:gene5838-4163_t
MDVAVGLGILTSSATNVGRLPCHFPCFFSTDLQTHYLRLLLERHLRLLSTFCFMEGRKRNKGDGLFRLQMEHAAGRCALHHGGTPMLSLALGYLPTPYRGPLQQMSNRYSFPRLMPNPTNAAVSCTSTPFAALCLQSRTIATQSPTSASDEKTDGSSTQDDKSGDGDDGSYMSYSRKKTERNYMGYSRRDFFKKVHNPRAQKPWRNRNALTTGAISQQKGGDDGVSPSSAGRVLNMGNLTTSGMLGMRSPHLGVDAAAEGLRLGEEAAGGGEGGALDAQSGASLNNALPEGEEPPSSPSHGLVGVEPSEAGRMTAAWRRGSGFLYPAEAGTARPFLPLPRAPSRLSIPIGKSLDLDVHHVETYEEGPIPVSLQQYARHQQMSSGEEESGLQAVDGTTIPRSKRALANAIRVPRHINSLFHKIMGWSDELAEVAAEAEEERRLLHSGERADSTTAYGAGGRTLPTAPPAAEGGTDGEREPPGEEDKKEVQQLVRKKMRQLTDRMKYGVLQADYEKDQFALEHKIAVAGEKMERKFLKWEGMTVLDQDHTEPMPFVRTHKAAVVMQSPTSAHIPVVNRDCCPGCGALLQDRSEAELGFVAPGEIERFVVERDRRAAARAEYGQRMAELQRHWETHGRRVGEEWLDFMTQEEFDAFYRDQRRPFVCHRCHALENLGVTGRRKLWSAPDFTEQLKALREKRCVVVLVVDITDFPGSMIHDLPGLISMNNPVIIAANKMDCVRNRSFNYKNKDRAVAASLVSPRYVKRWVLDIAVSFGLPRHQIKEVIPVSAKRGWNIDQLLASMEDHANLNLRRSHPPRPTYFVGAANVGKSSVINALAHYLYIPQPPHPESKKVYMMRTDPKTGEESVWWRWYTPPNVNRAEMIDIPSRHDKKASKLLTVSSLPGTTVAVNAVKLSLTGNQGKGSSAGEDPDCFLFDTPGVLPHWHATSPLTLLQMRRLLIRKFRHPHCFRMVPGNTLLLAGLAAIDVVKGCGNGMLFMVYTSHKAQHAIVETALADAYWCENLGKRIGPPDAYDQLIREDDLDGGEGDRGRLAPAPGACLLTESKTYLFECYARHRRRPVADVYVCGLGWVSFCVAEPADVVLRVRTLPGVVHGVRRPLRYNDLRPHRFWPKLRREFTHKGIDTSTDPNATSIATVVQLVAGAQAANGGEGMEPGPEQPGRTPLPPSSDGGAASPQMQEEAMDNTTEVPTEDSRTRRRSGISSSQPANNTQEEPERQWRRQPLPEALADSKVVLVKKAVRPSYQPASDDPLTELEEELHSLPEELSFILFVDVPAAIHSRHFFLPSFSLLSLFYVFYIYLYMHIFLTLPANQTTTATTSMTPPMNLQGKNVLITGGAGFIGSHVVDRAMKEGAHVTVVDNLYCGSTYNFAHHEGNKNFRFVWHDVTAPFNDDITLGTKFDCIFHLACAASPVHYQNEPIQTTMTCVNGTYHALQLATAHGCPILIASTSEVYGDPMEHPQRESYWGNVHCNGIRSCYDEGKRCAESLCFDFYRRYGTKIRVVRIFNTYGPRMSFNDGRIISNFLIQALRNDDITVFGTGEQTRSFQYVDDLVEGFWRFLAHPTETGPINMGNPRGKALELVPNCKSKITWLPCPQDDPKQRRPDNSKAKAVLDWSPQINVHDGLNRTLEEFTARLAMENAKNGAHHG